VIFIHTIYGYPRSIFLMDWLICTTMIGGIRFVSRIFREKFHPAFSHQSKKALIIGAGEAGVMVLREFRNNPSMNIEVVGFVDDDPAKRDLSIQGIKILGTRHDIPQIVNNYGIDEIIIAMPSVKGQVIRDIISHCQLPNVKIKIVPGLQKILNGDLEVKPRDVKPEDLLGREMVRVNEEEISAYIKNKRVLITGAGGSIGAALCRQIIRFNPELIILLDHNENNVYFLEVEFKTKYHNIKFKTIIGDVKDVGLLKHTFSKYRPQVIFHAARINMCL